MQQVLPIFVCLENLCKGRSRRELAGVNKVVSPSEDVLVCVQEVSPIQYQVLISRFLKTLAVPQCVFRPEPRHVFPFDRVRLDSSVNASERTFYEFLKHFVLLPCKLNEDILHREFKNGCGGYRCESHIFLLQQRVREGRKKPSKVGHYGVGVRELGGVWHSSSCQVASN